MQLSGGLRRPPWAFLWVGLGRHKVRGEHLGEGPGEQGRGETHMHVPLSVLLQWEVHQNIICKERGEDRLPGKAF